MLGPLASWGREGSSLSGGEAGRPAGEDIAGRRVAIRSRTGGGALRAAAGCALTSALAVAASAQAPSAAPTPAQSTPPSLTDNALSRMNQGEAAPAEPEDFVVETPEPETPIVSADVAPEQYTVRRGDTLSKIAQQLYGNHRRFVDILAANPAVSRRGHLIFPGQRLIIPRPSSQDGQDRR